MKIRIKGSSIRFRLTKSEVAEFCKKGYVEERTAFEQGAFSYGIKSSENVVGLRAEMHSNTITLVVPATWAADWDVNDKVGFQDTVELPNGQSLNLLLEKDFTCMDDREEDESDNYPNPKMASMPRTKEKE